MQNDAPTRPADIVREYAALTEGSPVHGVSWDGARVWIATGDALVAIAPDTGDRTRTLAIASHAGTAFDGRHLYQVDGAEITKLDPETGDVLSRIPAPSEGIAGLTWAEGYLWAGHYRDRVIHKLDPKTGAIMRTITSNRFVTGVTWANDELWHGTFEDEASEIRRVDPETGDIIERLTMPEGMMVSGLESDGGAHLYCGGGRSGKVRVVRRR